MKKTFDAVQWMRQRRTEIDEEDRGLTWEEKRRKTHEIVMRHRLLATLCSRKRLSTTGTRWPRGGTAATKE